MHNNRRTTVFGLSVALAVAACGSGDEETVPTTTDVVTTTSAPTAAVAGTVPTTNQTPSTTGAPMTDEEPPPFITTALDSAPTSNGWPLPAGRWQSSMFDPSLSFESTTDLELISMSPEAVVLSEVDGDRDARLTVLTPLAVGGDDNVPTAVPDDFEAYLRSVESVDIKAIRAFERDDGAEMIVADFTAREPEGHEKFGCSIGLDCLWLMKTSAGEDVHVLEGSPIRVVATEVGGVPIRVVASASDRDAFDRLATEAHHIAASLATTADEAPDGVRTFLATLGSRARSIPPGRYVERVGDQIVEFDVETELEGIALDHVGSHTVLFDVANIGIAYVVQPLGVVDPDAPQLVDGMGADDLVDTPRTADEHEAWLSQLLAVSDRTVSSVGGMSATSWATTVDDSLDHYPCGPPMRTTTGGRCVSVFMSELGMWSSSDLDVGGFSYFIDGTGVQVGGTPTDPDRIDEFDRAIAPLLDSIRFVS